MMFKRKNKTPIESEEIKKKKERLRIENTIFDRFIVFSDPEAVVNQKEIMDLENNIIFDEMYFDIQQVGDYAIVSKKYNVYSNQCYTTYGIIDSKLNLITDPDSERYIDKLGCRATFNVLYNRLDKLRNKKNNQLVKSIKPSKIV